MKLLTEFPSAKDRWDQSDTEQSGAGGAGGRSFVAVQNDWWVSISPRDAEFAALMEGNLHDFLEWADDVENHPRLIDLPGGQEFGKRPISGCKDGTENGWLTHRDGKRLPNPFLTYARKAFIPDSWAGRRIFLHLDNARYHVTVSVNGREVCHYVGGMEPHRIDITDAVKSGDNLLIVTVGDAGVSGLKPFDVHNYTGTRLPTCTEIENNLVHPVKYGGADRGLGKVFLEAVPRVRVEWVFANPKVSRGELECTVRLVNESDSAEEVCVCAMAIGESGEEKLLLTRTVFLTARSIQEIVDMVSWPDAVLWDTDNPHLYRILTIVQKGSIVLDRFHDYFGFREFSINGHNFSLNGKKIHLHGQSGHIYPAHDALTLDEKIQFFRRWKEWGHVNHVRLHARPQDRSWVEAADRSGMLITTETALWTTGYYSFDWVGSEDACYENVRRHFLNGLVRRDRNNPSVVIWSLSNEMSPITPYDLTIPKMAAMTRVFERVIAEAETEDDSRIIQMSSAMDFMGRLQMYNLHYPKNWQAFPDYPHTAYWIDSPFLFPWYGVGRAEMPEWQWRRDKPLYMGEFSCIFGATPDCQACIVGDVAFEDNDDGSARVLQKLWPMEVNAYRRRDVSGFCAWQAMFSGDESAALESWLKRPEIANLAYAMRPIAALCHTYRTQVFAEEEFALELSLHNDTRDEHELRFQIEAWCKGRKFWTEGMPCARYGPADNKEFVCRFKVPSVTGKSNLEIRASVVCDGRIADSWTRNIEIWPRAASDSSLPPGCVFLDPMGALRARAESRGLNGNFVRTREGLGDLAAHKLLWLNFKDAGLRWDDWLAIRTTVCAWVQAGGCAVLDDPPPEVLQDLPITLSNGKGFWDRERLRITYAYSVAPHHPILQGLSDGDFALWGKDYYLADRCWLTPQEGNARPLLVAGTDREGLVSSPLLELRHGQGSYLVSSLHLWPKLDGTPVALELLRRMAAYQPIWPKATASVAVTPETGKRLREVGWSGGNCGWREALEADISLLDGACLPEEGEATVLEAARAGKLVCLHDIGIATTHRLLASLDVAAVVQDGGSQGGHDIVRHEHFLSDGMSNNNLYWIVDKARLAAWTRAKLHPHPASALVRLEEHSDVRLLTRSGAVCVLTLGDGLLLIDNLRWQDAGIDEPERARRYLVSLLTNLGMPLGPGTADNVSMDYETDAERRERGHF